MAFALCDLGRAREAVTTADRALAHARAAGVHREHARAQWGVAEALLLGPAPVPKAIARCEELLADAPESLVGTVGATWVLGVLRAMNGELAAARELVDRAERILEAIAHPRPLIAIAKATGLIELLGGNPARAERAYRDGLEIAREIGDRQGIDALGVALVEALCLLGRAGEAAEQLQAVPRPAEGGSIEASARWRLARARVLALHGDLAEAESHARYATALVASTDLLNLRGDVMLVLAHVLGTGARPDDSAAALGEAVRLYERKGNVAAVALAHSLVQAKHSV
jgi:tetratricopeptide (TPR) repeat protein